MQNDSISIQSVSKSYQKTKALDNINLIIGKGELFGLIGPDGAGKTSLFRIITTLLKPDSGNISVFGLDVIEDYKKLRQIIGYMPGKFSLYQDLSIEENLNFFATVFGTTVEENYYLIKDIYKQIEPFKKRAAGKLSGGMKQKLALCCALIHKPELLVLDEPTTGVDAVSRKEFWEMLKQLQTYGITILVSTPYMDEASLCNRVALIQQGKLMTVNTPENIVGNYQEKLFAVRSEKMYDMMNHLKHFSKSKSVQLFGQYLHINGNIVAEDILGFLSQYKYNQLEINEIVPTIEDCFIQLMQPSSTH